MFTVRYKILFENKQIFLFSISEAESKNLDFVKCRSISRFVFISTAYFCLTLEI